MLIRLTGQDSPLYGRRSSCTGSCCLLFTEADVCVQERTRVDYGSAACLRRRSFV